MGEDIFAAVSQAKIRFQRDSDPPPPAADKEKPGCHILMFELPRIELKIRRSREVVGGNLFAVVSLAQI